MKNYNSKIFWHFTGGPDLSDLPDEKWKDIRSPEDVIKLKPLKPKEDAWGALKNIIQSKELWATATEKLYGDKKTAKFSCVTDIPLLYLSSHRPYYGDFALGFKSYKIYRYFNPVLYYDPLYIEFFAADWKCIEKTLSLDEAEERGYFDEPNNPEIRPVEETDMYAVKLTVPYFDDAKELSRMEENLLNYLKPSHYSDNPGGSFYREREWRKIKDFQFEYEDVAAIIVPQPYIDKMSDFLSGIDEAKGISLMSWEFLDKT